MLTCRKLRLYGCLPVSHIFLQSENEQKMEVGKRKCQTEEVKGARVLFGVVLLKVCCDCLYSISTIWNLVRNANSGARTSDLVNEN